MSKYQTFTPGEYLDWEKAIVEERIAIAQKDPPKDLGARTEVIGEYELYQFNHKWDPYNPLFNDKEYAQKAGYPNIPALPCFRHPNEAIMLVAVPHEISEIINWGHGPVDVEFFTPIFPGDTLTTETEKIMFEETTVPGSTWRQFRNGCITRLYNQKGELVVRNTLWRREFYRKIIDGSEPPVEERHWQTPAHYTTDGEWEYIKELWSKEYIRGKDTLYWEDVNVGDEPTWTCTGPISHLDMARWHGDRLSDPRDAIMKGQGLLTRDRFGQYLVGPVQHFSGRNVPGARMMFYNDTPAKLITRMVTNYIGDAGFVTRIGWIFTRGGDMTWGGEVRVPTLGGEYLDKVPYMKGKTCTDHGFEGDTIIAKGYVTDKYINDRGEHIIDLTCWGETLDKRIIEVVPASAKLPSKGG